MEIEAKELSELIEKIAKENGALIEKKVKEEVLKAASGALTEEQLIDSLEKKGLSSSKIEDISKTVAKHGMKITELLTGKAGASEDIEQCVALKSAELASLAKRDSSNPVTMQVSKAVVFRSSVAGSAMAMDLPDIGAVAHRGLMMRSLFRQRPVSENSNGVVRYTDQLEPTRAAAPVAEGGTYPESTFTWQTFTLNLQKIGDQIPVTEEALFDTNLLASQIESLLSDNVALAEDRQLWEGNGTAPNLRGILNYAPVYTAPDLNLDSPNLYDLIVQVQQQITSGRESKFRPTHALVSYADFNNLLHAKAIDGHYIVPKWAQLFGNGSANVNGIRVVPKPLVPANTMLVGDFRYGEQFTMGDIIIEVERINNQFITDMFTVKARIRTGLLVRNTNLNAFARVNDINAALLALD